MQILVLFTIIITVIIIIQNIISENRRAIVCQTSVLLKKLLQLNSQYNFDWNIRQQYTFKISLQSKTKFDRYELINLFDENVLNNNELMRASKAVERNRSIYRDYLQKVSCLKSEITEEEARRLHISYVKYIEIEKKLFQKQQLKTVLDCTIACIALYTSPKGRNHYSKKMEYKIDIVPKRYAILQRRRATQNSEEMRRKRARSQMTDKLRYSILKRDGKKCKICGRSAADGVKLHVDHIVPVSKGGETVPSNLQTLCETCNWGKSDEVE